MTGVQRGYHGEAAIVAWRVLTHTTTTAELNVHLLTAPLLLHRSLALTGDMLRIRDTVQNTSADPVEVSIVHHPAFGSPFIDTDTTLATDATNHHHGLNLPLNRGGMDYEE